MPAGIDFLTDPVNNAPLLVPAWAAFASRFSAPPNLPDSRSLRFRVPTVWLTYIFDEQYDALYSVAPILVKVAMELSYLCVARQADVLSMKKMQLLETGIMIKQSKTGVAQIKAWGPRLRAAIALAETLPIKTGMSSIFVLHQATGAGYTRDGFNSRWAKARQEAIEKFPELDFDFTFHDLKAKGVSDLEGSLNEKQAISGHKSASQTARYDRKIAIVPTVGEQ